MQQQTTQIAKVTARHILRMLSFPTYYKYNCQMLLGQTQFVMLPRLQASEIYRLACNDKLARTSYVIIWNRILLLFVPQNYDKHSLQSY